ncbi:hypothetical protein C8R43DRAFT_1138022 [Mycena crocata]|nr:hypothetical protein C8R43DRAFT_1138022 [Mycena crocata]
MPLCDFCFTNVGSKGMGSHLKACATKNQLFHNSASRAREVEETRVAASVSAASAPETFVETPPEPLRAPSPLPPGPGGRPRRRPKMPARYRDDAPDTPTPVIQPAEVPEPEPQPRPDAPEDEPQKWVKTEPNAHGLYKVFPNRPTHDPDDTISLDDLCRSSQLLTDTSETTASTPAWFPFINSTVARLMIWFHTGSNLKSIAELDSLINNVILHEDFDRKHLEDFSAIRENKRLDDETNMAPGQPPSGWTSSSVKLKLPAPKVCIPEEVAAEFEVTGILYRPLLDVMTEAFQSPAFEKFHITPFESRWDPNHDATDPDTILEDANMALDNNGLPPLRDGHQAVYGEIYTSPRMLQAHNALPRDPLQPNIETIIAAYMFWSDSTHLANCGDASLWPLYTFFGNLSKYIRAKPTANAGYHQAYFPSLPDSLKDFYRNLFGVAASSDVLAHLKRELMHAIWDLLLTPKFIHAYVHGIIIKCYDGVERRIFPRFFTYGADYPEKVLLATIKYFGGCPCPRCFIEKNQIPDMGTKADMKRRKNVREDTSWWRRKIETARKFIFDKGILVAGSAVNRLLKSQSWVPKRNTFSKLAEFGFNLFSMFVPDLLHEVELGVSLFIHTLRLLQAECSQAVGKLDERFRQIPTFGRSTIRRFHRNVSDMKQMAARDFEDILQCLMPALEGLLPGDHNDILLDLWFTLAAWHAYAKLRLHSSSTIQSFRNVTTELGVRARKFLRTTCEEYVTFELDKEVAKRARRDAQKNAAGNKTVATNTTTTKKRKNWNTATYKYHALGDYPDVIPEVGTTDSYSTQIGELKHCEVKKFFSAVASIDEPSVPPPTSSESAPIPIETAPSSIPPIPIPDPIAASLRPENETLPRTRPRDHHHISESKRSFIPINQFGKLAEAGDVAFKDFLVRLRSHILSRLRDLPYDGDEIQFSPQELMDVTFAKDRLYTHKVMRVNFTTYDGQRDEDSINPRTDSDIMVRSHEDNESNPHPYWYAHVVSIFHADVRHIGSGKGTQRMEFLWVRWFGRDLSYKAGWKAKRLHRLGFVDSEDSATFGFLDPAEIIRGSHIIPAFHYGRTKELLPPSLARRPEEQDED